MLISVGEVVVCGKKKKESETRRVCAVENDVKSKAFAGHALASLAHFPLNLAYAGRFTNNQQKSAHFLASYLQ